MRIKILFLFFIILRASSIYGQKADTVICNKSYYVLSKYEDGKPNELGQKGEIKNGNWITLNQSGEIESDGRYVDDQKDGLWWYLKGGCVNYEKGKKINKPRCCRCCPDF